MADKVDVFQFLSKVDAGDLDYWENLTDEEKKSIPLVVFMRWFSGTKNPIQIESVNSLLNPFVYSFGTKHKGLLYRLMLVASSGTAKRYSWIGKKKIGSKSASTEVLSKFYGLSKDRANSYLNIFTLDEVLECAGLLGYDDADIKKIKNEFK